MDLRQWSCLEIRPNVICRSKIPQKQHMIIIIIISSSSSSKWSMIRAFLTIIHITRELGELDSAKKHFTELSKYYEIDKRSWFYETFRRLSILRNKYCFFPVNIHYHNSYYIIYSNNLTGKSDKNHNDKEIKNKYLIIKAFRKFNRKLSMRIIRIPENMNLSNSYARE